MDTGPVDVLTPLPPSQPTLTPGGGPNGMQFFLTTWPVSLSTEAELQGLFLPSLF